MILATKMATVLGGNPIPATFSDDFERGDGAVGNGWQGSSWTIASGRLVNTPTLSAELLANGDMETGSPPTGWSVLANTAVASVADPRPGSSGSTALSVTRTTDAAGTSQAYHTTTAPANVWILFDFWVKVVTASGGFNSYNNASPGSGYYYPTTSWEHNQWLAWATAAGFLPKIGVYHSTSGATGKEVRYDDCSVKQITDLFMGRLTRGGLQTVKCSSRLNALGGGAAGVWMCGNSATNPTSYVLALNYRTRQLASSNLYPYLIKCVNGVFTTLVTGTAVAYADDIQVEIRRTATNTFQLWHNNIQVGTDQTVTDSEIINNAYSGTFLNGGSGNSIGAFFQL